MQTSDKGRQRRKLFWGILIILSPWPGVAQVAGSTPVGVGDALGIGDTLGLSTSVGGSGPTGLNSLSACTTSLLACSVSPSLILLDFTGRRENVFYVDLKWTTTDEVNNSGFWVDRSLGSPGSLSRVFFVPGTSNPGLLNSYERPDTNSYAGQSYYRLEQVDLDGRITYSSVIEVDGIGGELKGYPNPNKGSFVLTYPAAADGNPYTVNIYNGFGQGVARILLSGQAGSTTVDLTRLAAGTYFLECQPGKDKGLHTRIIIVK